MRSSLLFAASLAASFLPGLAGLVATGLAGALLFAYALQGLAVIHVFSRGMPLARASARDRLSRILLLGWVAIVIAILGLGRAHAWACATARRRGRQPPKLGGSI